MHARRPAPAVFARVRRGDIGVGAPLLLAILAPPYAAGLSPSARRAATTATKAGRIGGIGRDVVDRRIFPAHRVVMHGHVGGQPARNTGDDADRDAPPADHRAPEDEGQERRPTRRRCRNNPPTALDRKTPRENSTNRPATRPGQVPAEPWRPQRGGSRGRGDDATDCSGSRYVVVATVMTFSCTALATAYRTRIYNQAGMSGKFPATACGGAAQKQLNASSVLKGGGRAGSRPLRAATSNIQPALQTAPDPGYRSQHGSTPSESSRSCHFCG